MRSPTTQQSYFAADDVTASMPCRQAAVAFYVRMHEDTTAVPTGAFEQLMDRAERQGSVTPAEIAEVLNTDTLPVEAETRWSVSKE